ncbi:hypothetical protein TrST_g12382 [Triparma strigata]|uniref:SGNH hydrolase-type esterase domain-containing protein n=1 Tax=Triparma strigata TaxID=1606541 RepID=A0A9W7E1U0_9STRA|nr:hypothetical protein TrST_g12382 [Triparma strigata]
MSSSRALILLLGDSITQQSFTNNGFGAALANWYSRTGDVVLRGFSGYNTKWWLEMLNDPSQSALSNGYGGSILQHSSIASNRYIITLFLGANDQSSDSQGVPPSEYSANILSIISNLRSQIKSFHPHLETPPTIILITPGPVDSTKWPTRSTSKSLQYASILSSISSTHNLPLITLTSLPLTSLSDGLHFGPTANEYLFSKIQETIRNLRPDLAPDDDDEGRPTVKMHMPYWGSLVGEGSGEKIQMYYK